MHFRYRVTIDKKNNRRYSTITEGDDNILVHDDYIAFFERKFDLLSCKEIQYFVIKSGCDLYHNLDWSLDSKDAEEISMLKKEIFFYDNVERKEIFMPHDKHLQSERIFSQYDLSIHLMSIFLLCIDDRTFRRMEEHLKNERLQNTTKSVFKVYVDVQKYICTLWSDEYQRKNAKPLDFYTWAKGKGFILPDVIDTWLNNSQNVTPSEQEATLTIPQKIAQQYIDAANAETKGRRKYLLALLDAANGMNNKDIRTKHWATAKNDNHVSGYIRQGYDIAKSLNLPPLDDYLNKTERIFQK